MNIDRYINDGQDPKVVEKLLLKLQYLLASNGETVSYIAVQKKPAVTLFPDSIAITDKRVFICRSTNLGFADNFEIFPWPTIAELSFKEGILGAKVTLALANGDSTEIGSIPKNQARKLYQLGTEAQTIASQPLIIPTEEVATPTPAIVEPEEDELTLRLKKLKSLFERQLITQEEYENKKNELLNQL